MTDTELYLKELRALAEKRLSIIDKKVRDYAQEDDPFLNFKVSAQMAGIDVEQGMVYLMAIKLTRIANLLKHPPAVTSESINDSLNDLSNYADIMNIFREFDWDAPSEPEVDDTAVDVSGETTNPTYEEKVKAFFRTITKTAKPGE